MNLLLVGTGERAEALAELARRAGNRVTGNSVTGNSVIGNSVTDDAAPDLWVLALPPGELRAEVRRLALGPEVRALVAVPGLEPGSGERLSTVVSEESACLRVGALGGPIVPAEVRRKSPCAGVVASTFDEVARLGVAAFHSPACRIYPSRDLADVELAGALVEVLTVALGVAHGMGLGVGAQAMLVTRGTAEGMRLARVEGGDPQTFAGLAGLGELVACAGLPDHPARLRGLALSRGDPDPALAALCASLLERSRDLPITAAVRQLATGAIRADEALQGLLSREVRAEGER